MWKNTVEQGRSQMSTWRMRIAYWICKATNKHTRCVIFTGFPLQQWLHKRASMFGYMYTACLVTFSQISQNL
jgi:hypothetical protein